MPPHGRAHGHPPRPARSTLRGPPPRPRDPRYRAERSLHTPAHLGLQWLLPNELGHADPDLPGPRAGVVSRRIHQLELVAIPLPRRTVVLDVLDLDLDLVAHCYLTRWTWPPTERADQARPTSRSRCPSPPSSLGTAMHGSARVRPNHQARPPACLEALPVPYRWLNTPVERCSGVHGRAAASLVEETVDGGQREGDHGLVAHPPASPLCFHHLVAPEPLLHSVADPMQRVGVRRSERQCGGGAGR